MDYEYMLPDFYLKPFSDMKKKDAQIFFDWFITEIPNRNKYLSSRIFEERGVSLDYSVDSLIDVWEWYEQYIYKRELTKEEYEKKIENRPDWVIPYISDYDLSFETYGIAIDVAIYYASVIIKMSEGKIQWGVNSQKKEYRNEPVLEGFSNNIRFNPKKTVIILAQRSLERKDKMRLIEMYNNWSEYINA